MKFKEKRDPWGLAWLQPSLIIITMVITDLAEHVIAAVGDQRDVLLHPSLPVQLPVHCFNPVRRYQDKQFRQLDVIILKPVVFSSSQ